jgi:hypothetical protein
VTIIQVAAHPFELFDGISEYICDAAPSVILSDYSICTATDSTGGRDK